MALRGVFLRFIALLGVYRIISSFVRFIMLIVAVRFIALVVVMHFIALVIAVRFLALVIVVRFIAFFDGARFIAFSINESSVCCCYCSILNDLMLTGLLSCIFIDIFSMDLSRVNFIIYIHGTNVFCFVTFMVKSWYIFILAHAFTCAP